MDHVENSQIPYYSGKFPTITPDCVTQKQWSNSNVDVKRIVR